MPQSFPSEGLFLLENTDPEYDSPPNVTVKPNDYHARWSHGCKPGEVDCIAGHSVPTDWRDGPPLWSQVTDSRNWNLHPGHILKSYQVKDRLSFQKLVCV